MTDRPDWAALQDAIPMEVLYQLSYVALKSNKAGVWTPGLVGSPSPCVKGRG